MSNPAKYDDEEDEGLSGSENDDGFDEDMEALRQACILTGTDPDDLNNAATSTADSTGGGGGGGGGGEGGGGSCSDSDSEDDLELVRNIQNRFSLSADVCQPLSMKPLCAILPVVSDEEEDDFETLRAIQRRFSAYDGGTLKNSTDNFSQKTEQAHAASVASENENSKNLVGNRSNACEGFPASEDAGDATNLSSDIVELQPSGSTEWHQSDGWDLSTLPPKYSSFPNSAQLFIDAIKRNRSCQKFLRSKLTQLEARIEENKKLKERVKILKDFQVSCRKITGRALSQRKDPRVQFISAQRSWASNDSKDKKISAIHYGPAENSHVANYRMALTKFPLSLHRKKWSAEEKEKLHKGIRQQFQEMVFRVSVDRFSGSEGSSGGANSLDNILASINDLEITPENIREFLPKVNWDQLASLYVAGRSGAECEAQWLNCEDPLINRNPWTTQEDKNLLFIVQERGVINWFDIAVALGTNRTPFQCLARFQRSLNAHVIKKEWTPDEDARLRSAVETFGENNWQSIASTLEGRTGTQCSNRWKKSLHPARERVGRWTLDEDKRLKVAVTLFGPKNWKKIAEFIPGRTQVQCRERWVNSLDPSLNLGEWTEEEDSKLKSAIAEHGYCWSKVAACVPSRTDNQCWRRWKLLLPHEVPLLQAARRIQKTALIGNFVDRESERPALGPNDFIPPPMKSSVSEPEHVNLSRNRKRKSRGRPESDNEKDALSCDVPEKIRSKRRRKKVQISSEEVPGETNGDEVETFGGHDAILKKKTVKLCRKKNNCTQPAEDHSSSHLLALPLMTTNGEGVELFGGPNTTKKKKLSKQHSKRNKCTDIDQASQSLLLTLESRVCNGDGMETFGGNNATLNKKKRTPKQLSRRSMHTTTGKEHNSVWSAGKSMVSGTASGTELKRNHSSCLDSTLLTITNGEEVDILDGDDASRKKMAPKPQSGRKIPLEFAEDSHSPWSPPERLQSTNTGGERVENSSLDGITTNKENGNLKQQQRRKESIEPSGECQDVVSARCQQDQRKKSKPRGKSCSKQNLGTTDRDDITLSCFLRNKLKKTRLKVVKNVGQVCSHSSINLGTPSLPEGVDQHNDRNHLKSLVQDKEAQTSCNGEISENISSANMQSSHLNDVQTIVSRDKEPLELVKGTLAHCETVKEPASVNLEVELEAGDITLASMCSRLKKKRSTLAKSGKGLALPPL